MKLPVALQLFTLRDDMKKDPKTTLRNVKKMGYDGIETCGTYDMEPAEYRALCDEIGLKIISAHVHTGELIDETEASLEKFKTLGVSYVAICAFWGDYQYGKAGYADMIKRLDRACALFKENGIQILYHNHANEFNKENGEYHLDLIINDCTDDNLLPEIDVCWAEAGHGSAADYLRKYSGRCPVVHLKDCYYKAGYSWKDNEFNKPDDFQFRPVGYGKIDMPEILDTSLDIGAKWVVVEQDAPSLDYTPAQCASLSINWLKALGW